MVAIVLAVSGWLMLNSLSAQVSVDTLPEHWLFAGALASPVANTYSIAIEQRRATNAQRIELQLWNREQRAIQHCAHFVDTLESALALSNFLDPGDTRKGYDVTTSYKQLFTLEYSKLRYRSGRRWMLVHGGGLSVKRWQTTTSTRPFYVSGWNFLGQPRCGQSSGGLYLFGPPPTENKVTQANPYARFSTNRGSTAQERGLQYTIHGHLGLAYRVNTRGRFMLAFESTVAASVDLNAPALAIRSPRPGVPFDYEVVVDRRFWLMLDIGVRVGWRL